MQPAPEMGTGPTLSDLLSFVPSVIPAGGRGGYFNQLLNFGIPVPNTERKEVLRALGLAHWGRLYNSKECKFKSTFQV